MAHVSHLNRKSTTRAFSFARCLMGMAVGAAALCTGHRVALADDSSPAPILQYFESTYMSELNRLPDIFTVGYGAVQLPPPYRADTGNLSVGYDVYDRFELGNPSSWTLYGTQAGLQAVIAGLHTSGVNAYIDLVYQHAGYSALNSTDGNGHSFYNAGGYPGINITLPNAIDGDFYSGFATGDQEARLAGLLTINLTTNFQMIRSPVNAGDSRNIRAGTVSAYGRLANVPTASNAAFYPDTSLNPIMVYDPTTGQGNIPIYPFNLGNPTHGTPTMENVTGYLMRNTQWMVQVLGADGFRIDAAKNMPLFVLNYYDRAVYRSSFRTLLNGQQLTIFGYSETYDGDTGYLATFVRKDINPSNPGTIGGNRDALNFPAFFALRDNCTTNGYVNSWYDVKNRDTFDLQTRNIPYVGTVTGHSGYQGVRFVSSADNGWPALDNVAYAYSLMMPGNAIVYCAAGQFGTPQERGYFPQGGRSDALGGSYGGTMANLVNLRNVYAQGYFVERWISQQSYAFERQHQSLTLLSNRLDNYYDNETLYVNLPWGTNMVELTGNAKQYGAPQVLTVFNDYYNGPTKVNVSFLPNNSGNHGVLIYGLQAPQGSLKVGGVAMTLPSQVPSNFFSLSAHDQAYYNGVDRVVPVDVVRGNSFTVTLNTNAVNLLGSIRDHNADGDNALVRLDGGMYLGGGTFYTTPGQVNYGFMEFGTTGGNYRNPGYLSSNGNGSYFQTVSTTNLADGYHYLTVRCFRHRDDGGPAVYKDFKDVIFVDRNPPTVALDSTHPVNGSHANQDFWFKSTDGTANAMHVFLDLAAGLSNATILSYVTNDPPATQLDYNIFKKYLSGLSAGTHVATVVTYRPTGTYSITRISFTITLP